jgi:hypothetical protein
MAVSARQAVLILSDNRSKCNFLEKPEKQHLGYSDKYLPG